MRPTSSDQLNRPPVVESAGNFFAQYAPPAGGYDELLDSGGVRRHWQTFASSMQRLGREEFSRRWSQAERQVHENGLAYSAFGDPGDRPRPWVLDPLPLLIPSRQWQVVSEGLEQRALLLSRVLEDLYGPRHLLHQGVLPAEVLFRHPGYHAPLLELLPTGQSPLIFYAADLARDAQGDWCVMADRSESPSGIGFALENRVVISRMLPQVFRECYVQRLAPFFMTVQRTLRELAPRNRDNPRVVMLTQSRSHENFFEDAFLARYLGYTLAEGPDLAVRNYEVTLKTLGGLLPVDVLMRRPNSETCDPLELPGYPAAGTAGLLQAVRNGAVTLANGLGSGLVESPVFMAFLPKLCQALLGEDLKLAGVPTWWCGDPASLSHALENLDDLLILPAYRRRGVNLAEIAKLNQTPRQELRDVLLADPMAYVAQQRPPRSTVPMWTPAGMQPGYVALRSYLVADRDRFVTLPGGLARTAPSSGCLESSLLAGEGSKDAWVLSEHPVEPVTLLPPPNETLGLRRVSAELPSRAADNLFWLGRQIERVESAGRLLRTVVSRLTSETGLASFAELPVLLRTMADLGHIDPGFAVEGIREQQPAIERALPSMVMDGAQQGRLRSSLDETLRLAGNVRDRLSIDAWRIVLRLDELFRPRGHARDDLSDLLEMSNQLIIDLAAFSGMMTESMTRTQGFRFLDMGRRLERGVQVLELLRNCFVDANSAPSALLEAVLEIADSLMTYRARYFASLQLAGVLDLLLTDETNPRSLAYQLVALHEHVERLPRPAPAAAYAAEQRLAMSLVHDVRMADIERICEAHRLGNKRPLADLLAGLTRRLPLLSNAISHRYLVHAGPSHQLSEIRPHVL